MKITTTRQHPIIIIDFNSTIEIGATESTACIPVVGYTFISGMIYSSKDDVTLTISQGCNDTGGSAQYRYEQSYTIKAGQCEAIEMPIFGKFIKISIQNGSGAIASVEAFLSMRGIE